MAVTFSFVSRAAAWMLFLGACTPSAVAPAPKPALPADAPIAARSPVVVFIVVDQLASWVFEQRRATFSEGGGFQQLLREGLYAPTLRYEHATTSTAPGHVALFTGLPPRESGVFANERLDESNKSGSVFMDLGTRPVVQQPLPGHSASAAALRVDTLADALRSARPDAQIIALSLKDHASVPSDGKRPTLSV